MRNSLLQLIAILFLLVACAPPAGDAPLEPVDGAVYINSAQLLIMESYPVQVALIVTGDLPTPCHELRYHYEIQDFGDEKRVEVTMYSHADPEAICVQVLQPFEERISFDLQNAAEGTYLVYLNGEQVGEFNYPA